MSNIDETLGRYTEVYLVDNPHTPLAELAEEIHPTNVEKGFWNPPEMMDKYVAKQMLIVSEVAEVMEALRKSKGPESVTEEIADIFIRTLDLYKVLVDAGLAADDLDRSLADKVEFNKTRPNKHGNVWG